MPDFVLRAVLLATLLASTVLVWYISRRARRIAPEPDLDGTREAIAHIVLEGFAQGMIVVPAGEPVRLVFQRDAGAPACTRRVRLTDFGKAAFMLEDDVSQVEFVPERPGRHVFSCIRHRHRGQILVKPQNDSSTGVPSRQRKSGAATFVLVTALLQMGAGMSADAPPRHRFVLQSESQIRIEGSSTVKTFTCEAGQTTGYLIHQGEAETAHANAARSEPEAFLTVPVASFTCGDQRMDRDLYRALKASEFPETSYELVDVEVLSVPPDARRTHEIRARGNLTVGGVTRRIENRVTGIRLADGRLRATGVQDLMMSDFDIERPTALWGLM